MCNRYRISREEYDLNGAPGMATPAPRVRASRGDRYPKYEVPVFARIDGVIAGATWVWGFNLPYNDALNNAQSETINTKQSFRTAARQRRCLLPLDGWVEWKAPTDGLKGKIPCLFAHEKGFPLFAAGLWMERKADGRRFCTMLTRAADGQCRPYHHRMPLFLHPHAWLDWLSETGDPPSPGLLEACLTECWTVTELPRDVRTPKAVKTGEAPGELNL